MSAPAGTDDPLRDPKGRFAATVSAEAAVVLSAPVPEPWDRRTLLGPAQARLSDVELDDLADDDLDLAPGPTDKDAVEHALWMSSRDLEEGSTPEQLAREVRVAVFRSEGEQGVAVREAGFALYRHSRVDGASPMEPDQESERLTDGARTAVEEITESSRRRSA